MKKQNLKLLAMFFIVAIISSCSNDEISGSLGDEKLAAEQNATENNKIKATVLEEGVLISGASKQTGNPPAPNSNIDFQLNTENTMALQKKGVNIEFNSSVDVAGAYIRFKETNGTAAVSYFNVPVSSFSNKKATKTLINNISNQEAKMTDAYAIDVDFTDVVPAGEFCYDICIYDSSNNISTIESVCVVVEAWGGNADLVGNWIYLGSSHDNDILESLECNNGNTLDVEYDKVISREIELFFNENGDYDDSIYEEAAELNWEETKSNCSPIYFDNENREIRRYGNWAYDQRSNKLSIVMFKYVDLLDSTQSYEDDGGELLTDALVVKELNQEMLILEEVIEDGSISESITYTFKRK